MLENRWILLLILTLTWGSSFILIKKSLLTFSPNEIGAFRVGISGLILMFIGFPVLRKMPPKLLLLVAVTGFFGNFLPMFLFPLAQTKISSSLAGILDATMPVFVLVLGFLMYGIKSSRIQLTGAIIGFAGAAVMTLFSGENGTGTHIWYAMAVLIATVCYAVSTLIIKQQLQEIPSLKLSAAIYTLWMIPSLLVLPFTGFLKNAASGPLALQSLGYLSLLAVVGTAIAMMLYYKLIQNTTPVFASAVTYLMPLVSVFWGVADGEIFTFWHLTGSILILLSIYLIGKKKRSPGTFRRPSNLAPSA